MVMCPPIRVQEAPPADPRVGFGIALAQGGPWHVDNLTGVVGSSRVCVCYAADTSGRWVSVWTERWSRVFDLRVKVLP
jgi:hypothetical protein